MTVGVIGLRNCRLWSQSDSPPRTGRTGLQRPGEVELLEAPGRARLQRLTDLAQQLSAF